MIKNCECLKNKREMELRAKGTKPCFMQAMPSANEIQEVKIEQQNPKFTKGLRVE